MTNIEKFRICAGFVGVDLESASIMGNLLGVKSNGPIVKEYNPLTSAEQNEALRFELRKHGRLIIDSQIFWFEPHDAMPSGFPAKTIADERQAIIDCVCEVVKRGGK